MHYLIFSIFLLCIIAFIDVFFTIKKPFILRINILILIINIFLLNYISFFNLKEGFLFKFFPVINVTIGINFILFINFIIYNKINKWFIINLYSAFILASIFSIILFLYPSVYSFHNDQYTSFYVIPKYWYINIIRILFKFIILSTLLRLLYIYFKTSTANNLYKQILKNWMIKFLLLSFTVLINAIFLLFFNNSIYVINIFHYTIIFMSYTVLLTILYKPKFLSFHKYNFNTISYFDRSTSIVLSDYNFIIPFFNNQYFLNKDANLEKFCNENNIIDKDEFNDVIVSTYKMSFNNLINKNRVKYFLEIVISSKYQNYSIDALAQEAGFSSRHHLYKPFKKFHGGTPSDFLYFTNDSLSG